MKLALMMAAGLALAAQSTNPPIVRTAVRASQVREPAVPVASVRVVMPNGTVVYAQLDGSFQLDTRTSPPTLRVVSATPPATINTPTYHQIMMGADGTYAVPDGTKSTVYRNGLLQMPGIDYVLLPTGLRFLGERCCEADEIVVIAIY